MRSNIGLYIAIGAVVLIPALLIAATFILPALFEPAKLKIIFIISSLVVFVVTLYIALPGGIINPTGFLSNLSRWLGWLFLSLGALVWLAVNFALWRVFGQPVWLSVLLVIQALLTVCSVVITIRLWS